MTSTVPADWDPAKRLLTTKEAAKSAKVSPVTVRRWAQKGWITPADHEATPTGRGGSRGRRPLYLELDVLRCRAMHSAVRVDTVSWEGTQCDQGGDEQPKDDP